MTRRTKLRKYSDDISKFYCFAKNKYELAKRFEVDFGCDIDEYIDQKRNTVRFLNVPRSGLNHLKGFDVGDEK